MIKGIFFIEIFFSARLFKAFLGLTVLGENLVIIVAM